MADIFISYKREDRHVAEQISIALEQLGFDVWWDFELLSGDKYRKVIREVIEQCPATIVLWSERAIESDFVMDEAGHAKALGRLCPVRIDGVALPFGFGQVHTDSLIAWQGELSHPGFQALVRALEARIGRKARLGAAHHTPEAQAEAAELEAFKAAQLAANASALNAFLRQFPRGRFAHFVRGQLETIEADAPRGGTIAHDPAPPPPQPPPAAPVFERTTPPPPSPPATPLPQPIAKKPPWPLIAAGAGILALALIIFAATPHGPPIAPEVARLDPQIRDAVQAARAAEITGNDFAAQAREAAVTAERTAERARASAPGTTVLTANDGWRYETDFSNGQRNGYGVGYSTLASDGYAGDREEGQWKNGMMDGLVVYSWAENKENTSQLLRYEGQAVVDKWKGYGALYWRDGRRYVGQMENGWQSGAGVYRSTNGWRYEGQFSQGGYSGYGVLWAADGSVYRAGFWDGGQLKTPIGPQGPP